MITPRISVVLAVRNGERHLEASVRSILGQSFDDFELIAVDDGSTDATPAILSALRSADARVAVVRQEHRGLAASLNTGIDRARGVYVARQDADDISRRDRFERQAAHLDRVAAVAAVGSSADVIDRSGAVVGGLTAARGPHAVKRGLLTLRNTPVHGSMMMRRSAVQSLGGYRPAFPAGQDYDLWLRMSERYDLDNLPDPLYQWRLDPESVYATRRATQLRYAGIARAFAGERTTRGSDSYALLESSGGDLDAFLARYPPAPRVYALWAELFVRGLGNSALARTYFRRAVRGGHVHPRTLALLAWTHLGLPWPGGRPLRVADASEHQA
jgi:glycosyltransferase involved in cell wall biosynthesis